MNIVPRTETCFACGCIGYVVVMAVVPAILGFVAVQGLDDAPVWQLYVHTGALSFIASTIAFRSLDKLYTQRILRNACFVLACSFIVVMWVSVGILTIHNTFFYAAYGGACIPAFWAMYRKRRIRLSAQTQHNNSM